MQPLPAPSTITDPARLDALTSYAIFDTPPEKGFDDLAKVAALLCGVPTALVTLVDDARQFFKAREGFDGAPHAPLDAGFCPIAVRTGVPLVIRDTVTEGHADNPAVSGGGVRFYAGMPLRTEAGAVLGTLCVLDRAPRPEGLTPAQASGLERLADQVVGQLELRRALVEQRATIRERRVYTRTQEAIAMSEGDLDTILDALVTGAMQAAPAAQGGVMELLDGEELEYRSVRGSLGPHRGVRVPLDGSTSGACARTGEPILLADALTDPRVKADLRPLIDLRSAVHAPVTRGGRVLGVLKLQSSEPDAFTAHDLELVRTFAGLATAGLTEASEVAAQRAMLASERRHRTVTDHLGQAVFQMDERGDVTFMNPAAEAMFGWTAAELIGRNLHEILHHSRPDGSPFPAAECQFVEALQHGRTIRDQEDTFFRRDGTPMQVLVTNAPVLADGVVASAVLTVSDITERRQAEVRQAALLALGDRLRDLHIVPEMTAAAAEIVGRTLGAMRAAFGRVDAAAGTVTVEPDWTAEGQTSIAGRHRFADYGDILAGLLEGTPLVVADVAQDPRTAGDVARWSAIGVASLINMPVCDREVTVAIYLVHDDRPRRWRDEEIAFVKAVADRVDAGVARVRAEEQQRLLNHELSHRMKNTLTMVLSIARQTLRAVPERGPVEAFEQRVQALSSAHDLLLHSDWAAAPLRAVAEAVLDTFGRGDRIALDGSDVMLGSHATLSVSLLLHEMATNAAKYGALSVETGRVALGWALEDGTGGPELVMRWQESGGPPAAPPTKRGFGSRLIRLGLVGTGGVELAYLSLGLEASMRAPLTELQRA